MKQINAYYYKISSHFKETAREAKRIKWITQESSNNIATINSHLEIRTLNVNRIKIVGTKDIKWLNG
jgi:hypothetical protein